MKCLGFYDGKIIEDINTPVVSLEDRGYQFGDGVYEVIVSYTGEYFALKEHLDRLEKSCQELELQLSYSRKELEDFCHLLLKQSDIKDAMLYIQLTRGVSPRTHAFPAGIKTILSGTIRPRKKLPQELFNKGVKVIMIPDERWLKCHIKSLNLLGNILAKQKSKNAGCFEAIQVRDRKMVTEGSSCNCFCVKNNIIYTAPLGNLILAGVTRNIVIDLAKKQNLEVHEEYVSPDFFLNADEIFLTGTSTEVMPVVTLDDKPIRDGKTGPITKLLQQDFWQLIGKNT